MCPGSGTVVAGLQRGIGDDRIGARSGIADQDQITLLCADRGYEVGSTAGPGDADAERPRTCDLSAQDLEGYGPILQMVEVSDFLQSLVQISVNVACARRARAAAIGPAKLGVRDLALCPRAGRLVKK